MFQITVSSIEVDIDEGRTCTLGEDGGTICFNWPERISASIDHSCAACFTASSRAPRLRHALHGFVTRSTAPSISFPASVSRSPSRAAMARVPASCLLADRDPGAPDDPPAARLTLLARLLLSLRASVTQTLALWHRCVTHTLAHPLLLVTCYCCFVAAAVCSGVRVLRLQLQPSYCLLAACMLASNLLLRRRALGCENSQSSVHVRFSRNFQVYLKQALETTKIMILSRISIKIASKIEEVIWYRNVFKTFIPKTQKNATTQRPSILCVINPEVRDMVFAKLQYNEVFRLRLVCKSFGNVMKSDTFKFLRAREGLFGPNVFYLEDMTTHMTWQWTSYDTMSKEWRRMPSFSPLPLPDADLFKDFVLVGKCGLMCVDVGKGKNEKLIMYQPLTRETKVLPPLIHRRRPVLIHVIVNDEENAYKIIVGGSSKLGTEHLSRKTEVYDSRTNCWSESDDIPGPDFALNEYQPGVYVKKLDTLFCIGFLSRDEVRGILAYHVTKKMWIKDVLYQLPDNFALSETRVPTQITIAQLIEYDSEVFLFSEQEVGQEITHSIHQLLRLEAIEIGEYPRNESGENDVIWKKILGESRNGTRGLLVYPEFECLAHGKNQFCIFNTIERCGTLYTVHSMDGKHTTRKKKLPPFPKLKENSLTFHTLNTLGSTFEMSFKTSL